MMERGLSVGMGGPEVRDREGDVCSGMSKISALLQIAWDLSRDAVNERSGWHDDEPPSRRVEDYHESVRDLAGALIATERMKDSLECHRSVTSFAEPVAR